MKKRLYRILAIFGILLLIGIVLLTILTAFLDHTPNRSYFKASIFSMIAVPVLLYAYLLIYRLLKKK